MTIDLIKNNNKDDFIFVSGLTRSGKALLCAIVVILKNLKVNANYFLQQIPFLKFKTNIS